MMRAAPVIVPMVSSRSEHPPVTLRGQDGVVVRHSFSRRAALSPLSPLPLSSHLLVLSPIRCVGHTIFGCLTAITRPSPASKKSPNAGVSLAGHICLRHVTPEEERNPVCRHNFYR